jgi:hypothetical protein
MRGLIMSDKKSTYTNNVEQLIEKINSGWERMFPDSDAEKAFIN